MSALFGYILLFIGLRGLNWSVTIAQLSATLLMTILRAILRRGLTATPEVFPIPSEYELDWLATRNSKLKLHWPKSEPSGKGWWGRLWQNKEAEIKPSETSDDKDDNDEEDEKDRFSSESFWPECPQLASDGTLQRVFEVRKWLGKLAGMDLE
jgi:hypothetical protein